MVQKRAKRLVELDIARALAICMIVTVHSYWFLASGITAISGPDLVSSYEFRSLMANLGLGLFFFLSGFVLYRNNQVFSTWHDVIGFFRKRVLRIFPLYWVALSVFIILFYALPFNALAAGYNPVDISHFPAHSASTILVYVLGLQALLAPQGAEDPIRLLWFVGVILVYYTVYPLIIIFSSRITKFIAISGLVYLAFWALQYVLQTVTPELLIFYGVFVGGILASKYSLVDKLVLYVNEVRHVARLTTIVTATAIPTVALVFLLFLSPSSSFMIANSYIAVVDVLLFLFGLFVVSGVKILATSPRDSSYRPYRLIAYSSYAIYLFHLPVLLMLGFALIYGLKLPVLQTNIVLILLGLPVVFVVGYLMQKLQDEAASKIKSRGRAKQALETP
jgi:peptidoglycan/LPS O-acetylase OafA/YrhL